MVSKKLEQFTVNLPLDFSEILNIFRIIMFSSFLRIQENFRKKLKSIIISKPRDERSNNFEEKQFMDAYNMVPSKTLSFFWFVI